MFVNLVHFVLNPEDYMKERPALYDHNKVEDRIWETLIDLGYDICMGFGHHEDCYSRPAPSKSCAHHVYVERST